MSIYDDDDTCKGEGRSLRHAPFCEHSDEYWTVHDRITR